MIIELNNMMPRRYLTSISTYLLLQLNFMAEIQYSDKEC